MPREEMIAKLCEFAALVFDTDSASITENTDITAELGCSSMQRVAMTASIENEFDVMIPVARFGNYKTIGDLADYILEEM